MIDKENPVEFMKEYCEFGESRVYILMGLARKRYNPELTHNTEIVLRKVIKHKKDIQRKYDELMGMVNQKDKNFYIYLSVNARNVFKAFFNYRSRMNNWVRQLVNDSDDIKMKFEEVDSQWYSELQRPSSRAETFFLVDVDDKTLVEERDFVEHLKTKTDVECLRETVNGYHIVTDTYDYIKDEVLQDIDNSKVQIKTDDMVFLDFIGGDSSDSQEYEIFSNEILIKKPEGDRLGLKLRKELGEIFLINITQGDKEIQKVHFDEGIVPRLKKYLKRNVEIE